MVGLIRHPVGCGYGVNSDSIARRSNIFFIASDILSFLVCFGCPICKNTRSGERMQWSDASWCHRGNVILLQAINFNLIQMQLFSNYKHYFEIPI